MKRPSQFLRLLESKVTAEVCSSSQLIKPTELKNREVRRQRGKGAGLCWGSAHWRQEQYGRGLYEHAESPLSKPTLYDARVPPSSQ